MHSPPEETNKKESSSGLNNRRIDRIIEILLRDYEAIRAEIRAAEVRHEKVSLWLSSGLFAATAACFKYFPLGFAFIPMVILSYYAHRLYSHSLHIATLSRWIMRIEDLVDMVLKTRGLLDWERSFARLRLESFSIRSVFSTHYITEAFLLLPSVVVFAISVIYAPEPLAEYLKLSAVSAKYLIWIGYPALLVGLWGVYFLTSKTEDLESARYMSALNTYKSIVDDTMP
ncbi:MAG TPA: hypothetical protein ENK42_01600 [Deltaproteobacteria bacterium]|nr:hypothetical protein [Deltaproteobacteria bacterium]